MRIDSSGNVGIGISGPSHKLTVGGEAWLGVMPGFQQEGSLLLGRADLTGRYHEIKAYNDTATAANYLTFALHNGTVASTSNVLTLRGDGNVGIGTSSPQLGSAWNKVLHIHSSSGTGSHIRMTDSTSGETGESGLYIGQYGVDSYFINRESGKILFVNNGSERMRIDSSGNLLVGKTSTDNTTNGFVLDANGTLNVVRSSEYLMRLNRTTTDGEILRFQKDGTEVGSIGTKTNDLTIGTGDTGIQFYDFGNSIVPTNLTTNTNIDATIDLGLSGTRFKDLYLSGAVISNELKADNGNLILGDTAFSSSASYIGMKTSYQSGTNDYMIISGISDGNTYISAKDGSAVYIRGGGNYSGNEILVPDTGAPTIGGSTIWHAGNDGTGSGLDADLLDGNQATAFAKTTAITNINMNNYDITNLNALSFNDPGPNEGISWIGGSLWKIYESPNDLTTNSGGNLQFVTNTTRRMTLDTSGNLEVTGSLTATTKSFVIDHPTKPDMKLRHGSLEGPENGVYVRGRLKDNNVIELPDYWTGLVDEDTITVNLTAIGRGQDLWIEDIADNKVIVGGENINCFYTVFAERKDVERFEVEY